MKTQRGFSIIEALIVIVVLAIIGFIGYMAYTNFINPPKTDDAADTTASQPVKVETKEDLDKADKALDDVSLDDSDSGQLDDAADNF